MYPFLNDNYASWKYCGFFFLLYNWQQAKVIKDSIDFKVGTFCGSSTKSLHYWEKEVEEYEVSWVNCELLYEVLRTLVLSLVDLFSSINEICFL